MVLTLWWGDDHRDIKIAVRMFVLFSPCGGSPVNINFTFLYKQHLAGTFRGS